MNSPRRLQFVGIPFLASALPLLSVIAPPLSQASPDRPDFLSPAATEIRKTHDANRLHVVSTDHGRLFDSSTPAIIYDNESFLFSGTLLIGAIGPEGEPRVVNSSTLELVPESGPAGLYHDYVRDLAGGNRAGFGKNPDDDGDGRVDEDDLNGLDDDSDGRVDEDYQGFGDRMWTVTMRDAVRNEEANQAARLGLQVRQKVIQWSAGGFETLTALEYEIRNVGEKNLRDVYVGLLADVDIGPLDYPQYWIDDLVGSSVFDTTVASPNPGCPPEPLSVQVVWGRDVPDNGTTIDGGDTPRYVGFLFLDHPTDPLGKAAPVDMGLSNFSYSFSTDPDPGSFWPPRTDLTFYDLMSTLGIRRDANKPDDYFLHLGAGPFSKLDPGDAMTITIGILVGEDFADLKRRALNAQIAYNGRYVDQDSDALTGVEGRETCLSRQGILDPFTHTDFCDPTHPQTTIPDHPECLWVDRDCNPCTGTGGREAHVPWTIDLPPVAPASNVGPPDPEAEAQFDNANGDHRVTLQWNDLPERHHDPASAVRFEGYQIWRVDDWKRESFSDRPAPEEWKLLATYRLNPDDGLGVESPGHLDRIRSGAGRYEWSQTDVQNGRLYYYAVTAFGTSWRWAPEANEFVEHDVMGIPSSAQELLVMPAWATGGGCDDVRVVPNPYRAGAPWDLVSSDCDPSGSRLALRSLPEDWRRLDIYTLTGDLVFTGGPGESQVAGGCEVRENADGAGTFIWDLRSRGGDEVDAGIYLYTVEAPGGNCRGHFVIVR